MQCPTLELAQWKAISTPLDLRFRYDGTWNLCIDVHYKFGNRNKLTHSHIWNRDTVYPVMEELPLPGGATQLDELIFNVKGSQVYEYQYAIIAEVSQCTNVVFSVFTLATQPLKLDLTSDGLKTLCVLTCSEGGLLQQAYTTCGKCHDIFTEADYRDKAVNIAKRLRDKNHSNPMPKGGWSSAEQRAGMLLFLYSIPGYPQDLPQTLRAP